MKIKLILLAIAAIVAGGTTSHSFAQGNNVIADFISQNPDKSAIYMVQNGNVIADINADRKMPLASTVKIIIAIEYAYQAAAGKIDPMQWIDTAELDKYYIRNTDGNAHPKWLSYMKAMTRLQNGKVQLQEVAKGMIDFSSNANTEYLLDLLGVDNVNKRLTALGLTNHDSLYYFVSSLGVLNGKTVPELEQLSMQEYRALSAEQHNKMKAEPTYKNNIVFLPLNVQRVWSDRLPAATAKDYVSVMQKINSRTYFDSTTQKHLSIMMERLMDNPANQQWLKHAGMKGGSTSWVLTKALYATTTTGEATELAYFFNDLTDEEFEQLSMNMNSFELAVLTNRNGARDAIIKTLNGQ
jgi:D-alanyl-D-alanine carboxypeptidase